MFDQIPIRRVIGAFGVVLAGSVWAQGEGRPRFSRPRLNAPASPSSRRALTPMPPLRPRRANRRRAAVPVARRPGPWRARRRASPRRISTTMCPTKNPRNTPATRRKTPPLPARSWVGPGSVRNAGRAGRPNSRPSNSKPPPPALTTRRMPRVWRPKGSRASKGSRFDGRSQ